MTAHRLDAATRCVLFPPCVVSMLRLFYADTECIIDVCREAAKGYNVCQVCAFENFKASAFCMICGEKIVEEGADDAKPEGESGVQVHQFAVKPSFADHTANLTQRQLRVR